MNILNLQKNIALENNWKGLVEKQILKIIKLK